MQRTPTTLQPRLAAQTRSSGPHHERLADPRCIAVASCSFGGCDPSSVITASLFGCAVHVVSCVRCVARLARAVKKKEYGSLVIWSSGHDARFWFDGVTSSLSFFFQNFFSPFSFYYVRKPRHHRQRRHHTSNAGCLLQAAGCNAIHACRLPAEQEATSHACGSSSAPVSYTHLTLPTKA